MPFIMKHKIFKLIFLSSCMTAYQLSAEVSQETMDFVDSILIVEISGADLGISVRNDEEYQRNPELRIQGRKAISEAIELSVASARYVILNICFPDRLDDATDQALAKILKSSKKITLLSGSRSHREYTEDLFAKSVPEMGHFIFFADDPKFLKFNHTVCDDWELNLFAGSLCPAGHLIRNIALIGLEGYFGNKLLNPHNF